MKILVTYASAGSGHFKAAEAVYNYLKSGSSGHEVDLIDVLDEAHPFFRKCYSGGYNFLVAYLPWGWGMIFHVTRVSLIQPFIRFLSLLTNLLNCGKFLRLLITRDYDVIISAHFMTSELAAYLKQNKKIRSRLYSVVTDYSVHPFWVNKGTDVYITGSDSSKNELVARGVDADRVHDIGIPIDEKFLKVYDNQQIRGNLKIDKGVFTVLVMTGSFGIGPLEKIVETLRDSIQIIVVCGRNKKLFERLTRKNYERVKVFGFVDNVQELMSISDVIVTKPGGLTISESLAMDLPLFFISAIPGQETGNAAIMIEKNCALNAGDIDSFKTLVTRLKDNPDELDLIKRNIGELKKPFAVRQLSQLVLR